MKDICRLLFIAAAACAAFPAPADEDFAFTYRGRVTAQGTLPEELEVTYSLYRNNDETEPVWTQTKTERPGANGAFQSILEGDGLQSAFEEQEARFLGIRLGGTNALEQYPRQEILAIPLAEHADVVERASSSPFFGEAAVGTLAARTLSAETLSVTNGLMLADGVNLTLERVTVGDGATLSVKQPADGGAGLFGGAPHHCSIKGESVIPAGTELFSGSAMKGGFLVISTTNTFWRADYAAPCVTVPVEPGVVRVPVPIHGPAEFYFYEFGN